MLNIGHGHRSWKTRKDHGKVIDSIREISKAQKSANLVLTGVDSFLMISVKIICFVCIVEQ